MGKTRFWDVSWTFDAMVDCEKHFICIKMRHKQHIVVREYLHTCFFFFSFFLRWLYRIDSYKLKCQSLSHFAVRHRLSQMLIVSEMCVFLLFYKQCAIVAAIIADQGRFHCTVFLFSRSTRSLPDSRAAWILVPRVGWTGSFEILAQTLLLPLLFTEGEAVKIYLIPIDRICLS